MTVTRAAGGPLREVNAPERAKYRVGGISGWWIETETDVSSYNDQRVQFGSAEIAVLTRFLLRCAQNFPEEHERERCIRLFHSGQTNLTDLSGRLTDPVPSGLHKA